MRDPIERQAAISRISDLLMLELKGERLPTWEEVYSAIMELPSAQQWIPVSERLPEKDGDYLVTLKNGAVKILGYATEQTIRYPKGFYYLKGGFSWRQTQNPVIAWMPLPELYKEGGTDE